MKIQTPRSHPGAFRPVSALFSSLLLLLLSAVMAGAVTAPVPTCPGNANGNAAPDDYFHCPSFAWTADATDAYAYYQVQVATTYNFSSGMLVDTTTRLPRYVHPDPLIPSTSSSLVIYWRVRGYSSAGVAGPWSTMFHTRLKKPANSYTIPANASLQTIQSTLNAAADNWPSIVTFAPGTYNITLPAGGKLIGLSGKSNVIIDGQGATIILQTPASGFVDLDNCQNITVRNFIVDYNPGLAAWGTVTAVDTVTRQVTLTQDPASPNWTSSYLTSADNAVGSVYVLNDTDVNKKHWLKEQRRSLYVVTKSGITQSGPTVTLPFGTIHVRDIQVGDRLLLTYRRYPLVEASKCVNTAFYQITNYAAAGASYKILWGKNAHVLKCNMTVGPGRTFGPNADGIHAQANINGPWVEGCLFKGLGDDAFAYYQRGLNITASSGNTLSVADSNQVFAVNDLIAIFNPRDGKVEADNLTVTAVSWSAGTSTLTLSSLGYTPQAGSTIDDDQVFSRSKNNGTFYAKNNTIDGDRGKAFIMRCNDAVIVGNTISGASRSAIVFQNEPASPNGLESWNIRVEDNIIADCGWEIITGLYGDIMFLGNTISGQSATLLHDNVVVANNSIKNWHERAICIQNVADFTVSGNVITATRSDLLYVSEGAPCGIYAENSVSGSITGNNLGGDTRGYTPVSIAPNCSGVTAAGNTLP